MDDEEKVEQQIESPEDTISAIHDRIASLDAPVRDLLLSDQYVVTLGELAQVHSLEPKDIGIVESITSNFLLGVIRPSELEQTYIHDLSHLTKEKIQSLYKDIRVKILSPIWNIVEAAWVEDDENEQVWNEAVEMSEVPLPPRLQSFGAQTLGEKIRSGLNQGRATPEIIESIRPTPAPTNEEILQKNKITKPESVSWQDRPAIVAKAPDMASIAWEEKLDTKTSHNTDPVVASRASTDVTLPQVAKLNKDVYRESPQE